MCIYVHIYRMSMLVVPTYNNVYGSHILVQSYTYIKYVQTDAFLRLLDTGKHDPQSCKTEQAYNNVNNRKTHCT